MSIKHLEYKNKKYEHTIRKKITMYSRKQKLKKNWHCPF